MLSRSCFLFVPRNCCALLISLLLSPHTVTSDLFLAHCLAGGCFQLAICVLSSHWVELFFSGSPGLSHSSLLYMSYCFALGGMFWTSPPITAIRRQFFCSPGPSQASLSACHSVCVSPHSLSFSLSPSLYPSLSLSLSLSLTHTHTPTLFLSGPRATRTSSSCERKKATAKKSIFMQTKKDIFMQTDRTRGNWLSE